MEKKTRLEFLGCLDDRWKGFVGRYHGLAPAEQQAYLGRQGYASFAGLLAHVICWWRDGASEIARMRLDPAYPLKDYDVDAFNARAVESFAGQSEEQVIAEFEAQREAMAALVRSLSEAELGQENINTRLYYEILMHWTEHELN